MHNSDRRESVDWVFCMRNENEAELCTVIPGPVVPQVQTVVEEYHYVDDVTTAPPTSKNIKCKNAWVWKNACLSCLSGMTLESVMHVTQELHFSVMQERTLSCRIGNT